MTDDDILKFQESIETKIGAEKVAVIADDLGEIITKNSEIQKSLADKDQRIKELESLNEKLTASNLSMIKKIPVASNPLPKIEEEEPSKPISLSEIFDESGHFIK